MSKSSIVQRNQELVTGFSLTLAGLLLLLLLAVSFVPKVREVWNELVGLSGRGSAGTNVSHLSQEPTPSPGDETLDVVQLAQQDVAGCQAEVNRSADHLAALERQIAWRQSNAEAADWDIKRLDRLVAGAKQDQRSHEALTEQKRDEVIALNEAFRRAQLKQRTSETGVDRARVERELAARHVAEAHSRLAELQTQLDVAAAELEHKRGLAELEPVKARLEKTEEMEHWKIEQAALRLETRAVRNQQRQELGGSASVRMSRQSEYQLAALRASLDEHVAAREVELHESHVRAKAAANAAAAARNVAGLKGQVAVSSEAILLEEQDEREARGRYAQAQAAVDAARNRVAELEISLDAAAKQLLAAETTQAERLRKVTEDFEQQLRAARDAYDSAVAELEPLRTKAETARQTLAQARDDLRESRSRLLEIQQGHGRDRLIGY